MAVPGAIIVTLEPETVATEVLLEVYVIAPEELETGAVKVKTRTFVFLSMLETQVIAGAAFSTVNTNDAELIAKLDVNAWETVNVVVPAPTIVINPAEEMVATEVLLEEYVNAPEESDVGGTVKAASPNVFVVLDAQEIAGVGS